MRMKTFPCRCVLFLLSVIITPSFHQKLVKKCGIKLDDITKAISRTDSTSNFAPWVVSIGFGEDIEDKYQPLCTGTIITGSVKEKSFSFR